MGARKGLWIGPIVLTVIVSLGLTAPAAPVHANWLDRVKEIYQLPDNVEQIQKDYESTKQQLEEQKDKLSEAVARSQETENRLIDQNQALQKENELLQERLKTMEQLALDKEARNRKITYTVATAAGLLIFYFIFGRVLRLIVWRRKKHHTQ
ncbi:coiled-coil domain-containing protein [Paenibacillus sp. GCM10027628]|uniref:coiled-coil domain-containing protein n=1 Tax=Paenibacillus sp. GCM10027628 TaxID=3273413 RepID=UPI0036377BAC